MNVMMRVTRACVIRHLLTGLQTQLSFESCVLRDERSAGTWRRRSPQLDASDIVLSSHAVSTRGIGVTCVTCFPLHVLLVRSTQAMSRECRRAYHPRQVSSEPQLL